VRLIVGHHLAGLEIPYYDGRSETHIVHLTSGNVFPSAGYRHRRYDVGQPYEEPLHLSRPIVRRNVGAERINQMDPVWMQY